MSQLRKEIRSINNLDTSKNIDIENKWDLRIQNLTLQFLNDSPRRFLRWDIIQSTMFAAFYQEEFSYLKNNRDWEKKWRWAIRESSTGTPIRCKEHPNSSGNLIHHAYHLAVFEENTKIDLSKDIDFVFEFGGGYGSMCRLFRNLGFKGRYIIYDLPLFSAVQRYYLTSIGVLEYSLESQEKNANTQIISDILRLEEIIKIDPQKSNALFIGTWSLSEVPPELREKLIVMLSSFSHYLIAYQASFSEFDNINYFKRFQKKFNKHIIWKNYEIKHLPNNFYLFGKRINVSK